MIEGGRSICAEAGIVLAGGHSIDSPEPIFGLSVSGKVDINRLKKNSGAQVGDSAGCRLPQNQACARRQRADVGCRWSAATVASRSPRAHRQRTRSHAVSHPAGRQRAQDRHRGGEAGCQVAGSG